MQKIIAFALIFIGGFLAIIAGPAEVETIQIAMQADSYEATTAEITNIRTQSHGKGPSTEVVEFDYQVDGRTYHGDNHLTQFDDSRDEINALVHWSDGKKLARVYYDPDHPETVLLHQQVGMMVPIGVLAVTIACLYGGAGMFIEERRRAREEARERSMRDSGAA